MTAAEYDRCSLVLDCLMDRVASFVRTFEQNGLVFSFGGCVHFLVIFYLDRVNRPPVRWMEHPRIKVWKRPVMLKLKVVEADMLEGHDYDHLGCVDAAYGEKHPRGARDVKLGAKLSVGEKIKELGMMSLRKEIRTVDRTVKQLLGIHIGWSGFNYRKYVTKARRKRRVEVAGKRRGGEEEDSDEQINGSDRDDNRNFKEAEKTVVLNSGGVDNDIGTSVCREAHRGRRMFSQSPTPFPLLLEDSPIQPLARWRRTSFVNKLFDFVRKWVVTRGNQMCGLMLR